MLFLGPTNTLSSSEKNQEVCVPISHQLMNTVDHEYLGVMLTIYFFKPHQSKIIQCANKIIYKFTF